MSSTVETSGRACCPATAETGRARPPAEPPDPIVAMCAAHGSIDSACRFPAGTIFGDWRLTAFIGRGGNGEVYCAEHVTLGTPAAVKVLVRDEERAKIRFEREARLLARLSSVAFPRFFAYGEANPPAQSYGVTNGIAYLAMELLEPGELPTGDRAVAKFMLKVCEAVGELHALGYVHRDIKPGNILWRPGGPRARAAAVPVLADLGLIKDIRTSDARLQTSSVTLGGVGTPGYGAPEQMERGEATPASDIHALGVLADQCFNGNPPRAWKRIIERATSSIPAHRYQSVAALVRAIRWRHLGRYVIGMTVPLLVWAAISNIEPRTADFNEQPETAVNPRDAGLNEEPVTAVNTTGNMSKEVIQEVMRTGVLKPPAREGVSSPTNMAFASSMRLNGKKVMLSESITLEGGKEYRITGPGTLDADLFCPTTAVIRLKNCVLLNRTKRLYPENGIQYRLENGVYLNFINIKKKPLWLNERDFTGSFDGAFNKVRFGGPETVAELMEQISEEQAKGME